MKSAITAERLRELLHYDPETGVLSRRVRVGCAQAGRQLGTTHHGYLVASVGDRLYRVHRLIWLYVHGSWPRGFIDHINGERADNRIANLRDATASINAQNIRACRRDNKATGRLGVGFDPRDGRYRAKIGHQGRQKYLGSFSTADEAHAAYVEAKRRLHEGCTL